MSAPLPRRVGREAASVDWRRRYASYATPPRDCGCLHAFHGDPRDCAAQRPAPSTFSLRPTELYHHAADLAAANWQEWELRRRFKIRAVPAA